MMQLDQLIENRYRLIGIISYGASGVVWQARHEVLKSPLAVKMVDVGSMSRDDIERIQRECQIGGELGDLSNVVRVLDALHYDNSLLIVMDLMQGDLHQRLYSGAVTFKQALNWALDLASTLLQVHGKGIIHRDIKPKNILLDAQERVKFCDFGIARVSTSHLTGVHQPGTPAYKAPELEQGVATNEATDVYSLCAVFFEMWSGGKLYADYKSLETAIVRDEFIYLLEQAHPGVAANCREQLADVVLSGLASAASRANLPEIITGLQVIEVELKKQPVEDISPSTSVVYVVPRPTRTTGGGSVDVTGESVIVDWVVSELKNKLQDEIFSGRRHTMFFWYDKNGEWRTILPLVQKQLPLIVDEGSLLEVRYRLEGVGDKEPVIVYLQRPSNKPDYLTPYVLQGVKIEDLTLYDVLRRHGTPLPDGGESRKIMQNLLPQLLVASLGQGEIFWQGLNNYDVARNKLLGESQEIVFRFLATPTATWADLEEQGKSQFFVDELQKRYGFAKPGVSPDVLARDLFARWCQAKLYADYKEPSDFPFRAELADTTTRARCRADLNTFMNDRRYQNIVVTLAREVEKEYGGLLDWAQKQATPPNEPLLPGMARLAWKRAIGQIEACQQYIELLALVRSQEGEYNRAVGNFWTQQGETPGWQALAVGARVIIQADTGVSLSKMLHEAAKFVEAYTESWWKIDCAYRQYRELPEAAAEASALTAWVERSYQRYLETVNRSWTQLWQNEKNWLPTGTISAQTELWDKFIAPEKGKRAVFFIDALRYDIAQEVVELLRADADNKVQVTPVLAGLPSVTALGMSALLPKAGSQTVSFDSEWQITTPDFKGNLSGKAVRETYLSQNLKNTQSVGLDDLLKPQFKPGENISWLLVFSQEIDALGENVSEMALSTLGIMAQRIVQAIRKITDAGFTSIHIVTDHGFLLLQEVEEANKITPPVAGLKLGQRYLVGKDLAERQDVLRLKVRGSNDLWSYYPPGIAAFSTRGRYQYSHGGPSLHETVIPYIVVRRNQVQRKIGVRLVVPAKIVNAIFKVEIAPVRSGVVDVAREIKLSLETTDGKQLEESSQLVSGDESLKINRQLKPSYGLNSGTNVVLVARDAQTGEELDRQIAEIQVDLDL